MITELIYLSQEDISKISIPATKMLELVSGVLQEKQAGRTEMPPKLGVHPRPQSFIHAMPGYLKQQDSVGLKLVSYFPGNTTENCATINAMILLNDAATGQPLSIMDANWITAYRTAAVTALSCKLLCPRKPKTLGLIGYGIQAQSHLEVLTSIFPLTNIQVWGPNHERSTAFSEHMNNRLGTAVTSVNSAEQAVRNKDLVISVTPIGVTPVQQLKYEWLSPGTVVCPVEYDSAWDKKTFQQADIFVTDDIKQFDQYRQKDFFKNLPTPEIDLADLINANLPTRTNEIAVAVNLGIGLMDIAFAQELYNLAKNSRIGHRLPR
jgi:ornithine cyclodeaminase/alanine dehydrogenase